MQLWAKGIQSKEEKFPRNYASGSLKIMKQVSDIGQVIYLFVDGLFLPEVPLFSPAIFEPIHLFDYHSSHK